MTGLQLVIARRKARRIRNIRENSPSTIAASIRLSNRIANGK